MLAMKTIALGLLYSLTILIAGSACAAESLQQVLDKVASEYGAMPPAMIRETGTTNSLLRGDGSLIRLHKAPDSFHIEINYATSSEIRTMVGAMAWYQHTPANPVLRGAIALQAGRIAMPWNILAKPSAIVDLGTASTAEGKTVRVIEFPLEEQLKLVVEIDPETGHILRSRGIQSVGGNTIEFATVYSDFRKENGRIHPAHEEQFAMGVNTGRSSIEKVEYPASIPDSAFMP
jgi:hypothetical protein